MIENAIQMNLSGGLGNQIHQLAAGLVIANHLECNLRLELKNVSLGFNPTRRFELDKFDLGRIANRLEFGSDPRSLGVARAILASKLQNRAFLRMISAFPVKANYKDSLEPVHDQLPKLSKASIIEGTFADFEWIKRAVNLGLELNVKNYVLGSQVISIAQDLDKSDLAIHVRYGDYLLLPELFPIVTDTFLAAAIGEFLNISKIWIFTDDVESFLKFCPLWSKRVFRIISRSDFSAIESFWLLGKFHSIICGNSTFSTLASYFSPLQERVCVCFVPHMKKFWVDTLPTDWIRISLTDLG